MIWILDCFLQSIATVFLYLILKNLENFGKINGWIDFAVANVFFKIFIHSWMNFSFLKVTPAIWNPTMVAKVIHRDLNWLSNFYWSFCHSHKSINCSSEMHQSILGEWYQFSNHIEVARFVQLINHYILFETTWIYHN